MKRGNILDLFFGIGMALTLGVFALAFAALIAWYCFSLPIDTKMLFAILILAVTGIPLLVTLLFYRLWREIENNSNV